MQQRGHHTLNSTMGTSLKQDTECGPCCLAYGGVWVAKGALDGGQDVCQVLCELVAGNVLKQLRGNREKG
jgi:hypothetical protein